MFQDQLHYLTELYWECFHFQSTETSKRYSIRLIFFVSSFFLIPCFYFIFKGLRKRLNFNEAQEDAEGEGEEGGQPDYGYVPYEEGASDEDLSVNEVIKATMANLAMDG